MNYTRELVYSFQVASFNTNDKCPKWTVKWPWLSQKPFSLEILSVTYWWDPLLPLIPLWSCGRAILRWPMRNVASFDITAGRASKALGALALIVWSVFLWKGAPSVGMGLRTQKLVSLRWGASSVGIVYTTPEWWHYWVFLTGTKRGNASWDIYLYVEWDIGGGVPLFEVKADYNSCVVQ